MTKKQMVTWVTVLPLSWYGMMAIHEAGHCLGAVLTGATIDSVKIPVVGFSRTAFSGSGSPLMVVWLGPVLGIILPIMLVPFSRFVSRRVKHGFQFFMGFCFLANGAYIGLGSFSGVGDCRELVQLGSHVWQLVIFGAVSAACGLYVWHKMGPVRRWFEEESQGEKAGAT